MQVLHKAPLVEAKQIEHVVNERAILGELNHPFLVGLVGAYQDATSLYLLQVGTKNVMFFFVSSLLSGCVLILGCKHLYGVPRRRWNEAGGWKEV